MRRRGTGAVIAAGAFVATLIFGGAATAADGTQLASPRPLPLHRQSVPGPVPAKVLRVIDGDTLVVRARVWIGQEIEIKVRLWGVDTPELRGKCESERILARQARDLVAARIADGEVSLHGVQYGKFAGRVLARVETSAGIDLTTALLDAGLGRPYRGRRRQSWCPSPASGD
jgi:endonuclease YncB( thermonuclease family)